MYHVNIVLVFVLVYILWTSDGKAVAIRDNIPVDDKNKATRGRDECPVSAINLSGY